MLSPYKPRLTWLLQHWLPSLPRGGKVKVLDIGRYDPDEDREAFFGQALFEYHRLAPEAGQASLAADTWQWGEYQDESFDLVVSIHALEHAPYPWLTMTETARVLKPGGLVWVMEPGLSEKVAGRAFVSFNRHADLKDYYRFSPSGMEALADFAGLRTRHVSMNQAPPEGGQDWFSPVSIVLMTAAKPHRDQSTAGTAAELSSEHLHQGFEYRLTPPKPVGPPRPMVPFYGLSRQKSLSCVVLGSCTSHIVSQYLSLAAPDLAVRGYRNAADFVAEARVPAAFRPPIQDIRSREEPKRSFSDNLKDCRECDILFADASPLTREFLTKRVKRSPDKVTIIYPLITFNGFHPDIISYFGPPLQRGRTRFMGSRIILESYLRGYSESRALSFFEHKTYQRLGYYQAWAKGLNSLAGHFASLGLELVSFYPRWLRAGVFMYDPAHAKESAVISVIDALCRRRGLDLTPDLASNALNLSRENIVPIYPEIAEHLHLPEKGSYRFKYIGRYDPFSYSLSLDEFIHLSYDFYQTMPEDRTLLPRLDTL